MTTYVVTFERIGRHRPDPLITTAPDLDELADRIYDYARPRLMSTDVSVFMRDDGKAGTILCGFQTGGVFTIEVAHG